MISPADMLIYDWLVQENILYVRFKKTFGDIVYFPANIDKLRAWFGFTANVQS